MGYQQIKRDMHRATSNNSRNRNKNVCGLAVATALGVQNATRYLHTWGDLQRAIRTTWSFRSVKSALRVKPNETSVGAMRKAIRNHNPEGTLMSYVVMVEGHVLMLNSDGTTAIDTAPRKRDCRKVKAVYGVYFDENNRNRLYNLAMSIKAAEERKAARS